MTFDQISCSIVIGSIGIMAYLALCFLRGQKPDLTHAITIALSCSGIISAIVLGWLSLTSLDSEMGVLSGQKLSLYLGALAIMWVSITTTYKYFMHPFRASKIPRVEIDPQ